MCFCKVIFGQHLTMLVMISKVALFDSIHSAEKNCILSAA